MNTNKAKAIVSAAITLGMLFNAGSVAQDYLSPENFAKQAKVGQTYSCLSPRGTALLFTLGSITNFGNGSIVYHVQIRGASPDAFDAAHMPFSKGSFNYCLLDPEAKVYTRFNRREFKQGFNIWKADKGGVFDTQITDVFGLLKQP